MVKKSDILRFLKKKKPDFEREFNLTKIGLIGSFSRGDQTRKSDIDLIIEFEKGTENLSDKKDKIRKSVKEKFHLDVDLCREKYLKPYFRDRILKNAIFI